jgi:TonB family protein
MMPAPAPSPTVDPCNRPAAIVSKAPIRNYSPPMQVRRGAMARGASDPYGPVSINGMAATNLAVTIDVTVDAKGLPASVRVVEPSGDMSFDRASLDAALRSTYDPAKTKCAPALGHVTFSETLGPSF